MKPNSYPKAILPLCALLCLSVTVQTACSSGEPEDPWPPANTCLVNNAITISDIRNLDTPAPFDRVEADLTGKEWEVIGTVSGTYDGGKVVLTLPASFDAGLLQPNQRTGREPASGYWDAVSSDPGAGVAAMGDIIAFDGERAVGRLYLTDWDGTGSLAGSSYVYYQYAEREFSLSGSSPSYVYDAAFRRGWNAYIFVSDASGSGGRSDCTTRIAPELPLYWRFEKW